VPDALEICYLLLLPAGAQPPGLTQPTPELRDAPDFFDAHIELVSAGDTRIDAEGTPVEVRCQVMNSEVWAAECRYRLEDAFTDGAAERKGAIEAAMRDRLVRMHGAVAEEGLREEYAAVLVEAGLPTPEAFLADRGPALARLMRNLRKPPSPQQVEELLSARARFSEHDLTVVDWVGALVIAEHGDFQSEVELMKIGKYQLLRLRMLDRAIDEALAQLRAHVESVRGRFTPRGPRTLQTVVERRLELLLEFEKTDQSLLLIGDWYSARVYQLIVDNLYLDDWKAAVSTKLESLGAIDATVRESLALSWRRMLDVVSLAGWTFLMVAYIVLLVVRL
jgi:hypothetical protein